MVGPPNQDEIATRALAIAKRRGGGHGDETADWMQAESELRLERGLVVTSDAAATKAATKAARETSEPS